jgi:hypothetical protein
MFTNWDWTEILEGAFVSLLFLIPSVITILKRMNKHHRITMEAHQKTHDHLGIE